MQKKLFKARNLSVLLALTLVLPIMSAVLTVPVHAQGAYATYATPSRIQEGTATTIWITLTGATPNADYTGSILVKDPTGTTYTCGWSIHTDSAGTGSWSGSYPDYWAATTNYVGTYSIRVDQTSPTSIPNVASESFAVGLTEKATYERTETVHIQASGYGFSEPVVVNIVYVANGSSIPGYPKSLEADNFGRVYDYWKIPKSQVPGNYRVMVSGSVTSKPVADRQDFTVIPATLTIDNFGTCRADGTFDSTFERTQTVYVRFNVYYPSGEEFTSGAWSVDILTPPPGAVIATLTAAYNASLGAFVTSTGYKLPVNAQLGSWQAFVMANSIYDAWVNRGPGSDMSAFFSVSSAMLSVTVITDKGNVWASPPELPYQRTETISPIAADVRYPDGSPLTSGLVTVEIRDSLSTLRYTAYLFWNGSLWVNGFYKIPRDAPCGTWFVNVHAENHYGNDGYGTKTIQVTPATLDVSVSTNKVGYAPGETVAISAVVKYPDGTAMTGLMATSVTFRVKDATDVWRTGEIAMTYNPVTGIWGGTYSIAVAESVFGEWSVRVTAVDDIVTPGGPNTGEGSDTFGVGVVKAITPLMHIRSPVEYWPAGPQGANFNVTVTIYGGAGKVASIFYNITTPETLTSWTVNVSKGTVVGPDMVFVARYPTDFPAGANSLELGRYLVKVTVYFSAAYGIYGPGAPYGVEPNVFDVFVKLSGKFNTAATTYLPGDRITFDINVTDARGIPIGKLYAYDWGTREWEWWPENLAGTYYGWTCAWIWWYYGAFNHEAGVKASDGTWVWLPYAQDWYDWTYYMRKDTSWSTLANGTVPKDDQMAWQYPSLWGYPVTFAKHPITVPEDAVNGTYSWAAFVFFYQEISGYGFPSVWYDPWVGEYYNSNLGYDVYPYSDVVGKYVTGNFEVSSRLTLEYVIERMNEIKAQIVEVVQAANGTLYAKIETTEGNIFARLTEVNATITELMVNSKGEVLAMINTAVGTVTTKLDAVNASIVGLITTAKGEVLAKINTALNTVTAKLDDLGAKITAINGTVVTINTAIGNVQTSVADIGLKVVAINGTVARIETALGTMQGKITSVDGNVATIKTDVGTIKADVSKVKADVATVPDAISGVSIPIWIAVVLSLIAAIASIYSVVTIHRKIAG